MATDDTLAVYTEDDPKLLIQQGFTGKWRMNETRTGDIRYVMVVGKVPRKPGVIRFIGKVTDIKRIDYPDDKPRFQLFFDEIVRVTGHEMVWEGSWPTKYLDSADLPVNVSEATWEHLHDQKPKPNKIKDYQRMIAEDFGVTPDKVHISVSLT